jgi:hypothetical protein
LIRINDCPPFKVEAIARKAVEVVMTAIVRLTRASARRLLPHLLGANSS